MGGRKGGLPGGTEERDEHYISIACRRCEEGLGKNGLVPILNAERRVAKGGKGRVLRVCSPKGTNAKKAQREERTEEVIPLSNRGGGSGDTDKNNKGGKRRYMG